MLTLHWLNYTNYSSTETFCQSGLVQPLSRSATQPLSRSARVAGAETQPLCRSGKSGWTSGWVAASISRAVLRIHSNFERIDLLESTILPFCLPNGLDLRQTPQLRFSSIAKGLDTSRWAKPSRSRVRVQSKVHQSRIAIYGWHYFWRFFTQGAIRGSFIFLNHGLKLDCGHWVWQLLVDLDTADTGNTFGTLWPAIFDAPAAYRLLTALQNDEKRRVVQLSLTGCCNLTTKECHRHPTMSTRKRIAGQKMRSRV